MSLTNTLFAKDIVVDQEAFDTAVRRLNALSTRISTLRNSISDQLDDLRTGFDTPAGDKFFRACDNKLLEPMENQARIIQHVSDNLKLAEASYESIFQEYTRLNNSIRNLR